MGASPGGGISGIGVAVATLGGFLMYVGVRDVPIVEGLREITSGRKPTPRPKTPTNVEYVIPPSGGGGGGASPGGGSGTAQISYSGGTNPAFAQEAAKYLGTKYVWGGRSPGGFDCSGLVQYVISRVTGRKQSSLPATTYTQVVWSDFQTIPRSAVGAGDFLYWNGHTGIATSNTHLIHAPRPGTVVRTGAIDKAGPGGRPPTVCKRYKGSGGSSGPPTTAWA